MNSISIKANVQQAAANQRPVAGSKIGNGADAPVNGTGQNRGGFADHFAEVPADDMETSKLLEGAEIVAAGELAPVEGEELTHTPMVEIDGPAEEEGVELIGVSSDGVDVEEGVKTPTVEVPNVEKQPLVSKEVATAIPVVISGAEIGRQTAAAKADGDPLAKPQNGQLPPQSAVANNRNVTGRRENLKAEQETLGTNTLADSEGGDEADAPKLSRTSEGVSLRAPGQGTKGLVLNDKGAGGEARPMDSAQIPNGNGRANASANGNSTFGLSGGRGAENRLATMMEASDAFSNGTKITVSKQENHILPASPQQLTVSGLSRTVVSQVIGMKSASTLEQSAPDAKLNTGGPSRIIEVQLMPRNLGAVGITIRTIGGKVSISIETQSAEAERLIRTEVDKIAGAIRQAGQVLDEISIKRSVHMAQQTDSLSGDHESNRQSGANINQNSNAPLWQSANDEKDQRLGQESIEDFDAQGTHDAAAASGTIARQGIYL